MPKYIVAYCSEDYSDAHVEALHGVVDSLARDGAWSRGPPQFVDDSPSEAAMRTVGVQLLVSEPGEQPATAVDEPTRLLEALAKVSAVHLVDLEVQYGEEIIGAIVNGVIGRSLREGFLDSW
jgi:hypothetical protein